MLVSRMQFATALCRCCLVVISYRTQGACFYLTVKIFIFFTLGIDDLWKLPSKDQSGSFQDSEKVSKRQSCLCLPRTSMHLKHFPLIVMDIENHSVHRHRFPHCCLCRLNLGMSRNSSAEEEDQPSWRYTADLAATTPASVWIG